MALINCKECGNQISSEALSCPHCGRQLGNIINKKSRGINWGGISYYSFILLLVGVAVYTWWAFQPKNLAVGIWSNEKETIEIFSDNTLSIISPKQPAVGGTFLLLNDGRAKIELGGLGALLGPVIITYEVSAEQLMINDGKTSTVLKRTSSPSLPVRLFAR